MKSRISRLLLTIIILAFVAGIPSTYAETIALRLSDGTTTVTVYQGSATNSSSTNGVITYKSAVSGAIGAWNIDVSTGTGSVVLGPGSLGLSSVNTSSLGTGGYLDIMFTQTGNTATFPGWLLNWGGSITNIASATYSATYDNSNTEFGNTLTAVTIGTVGPFSNLGSTSSPYSGSAQGLASLGATYSLTQKIHITGTNNGSRNTFSGNANLNPLPEPASLVLLGLGILGIGVLSRRGPKVD